MIVRNIRGLAIGLMWGVCAPVALADEAAGVVTPGLEAALDGVGEHPRLLLGSDELAALRERVAADATSARIARTVMDQAAVWLDAPPPERRLEGRRMLRVSREAVHRLITLAMAWRLTDDPRFADRAAADMRVLAAFDDWNPSHFLDTAEMSFGMAVAYDWLHDALDEETRALVRSAILDKAIRPALASDRHWWIRATNNWNQVCHGGLVAGALVTLEDDRDAALHILDRAVQHLPRAMSVYAPEGAYPEGPGYWAYGTSYNVLLLAMLESALGGTFGLENAPGFDRTGAFPMLVTGPSGETFNYADGSASRAIQPAVYWLARRFGRPEWAANEDTMLDDDSPQSQVSTNRLFPLLLVWRGIPASADATPPLHWTSRNKVPVSLHREAWGMPEAAFAGLKAGSPAGPHGQMDAGSFIFDADGVRWAHDLGAENYHRIESRGMTFWPSGQTSERWKVFRQNNLSHNTLVIDGALQVARGDAPIMRFSADPAFPHSVVDLTPVYAGQLASAHRGVALLPGGALLVRDHLTGLAPGAEVRWGMVTRAAPDAPEGTRLTLREDGESLEMTILGEPPGAEWSIIDTAKPRNEWDSPNPGTRMAAFTATAPADGTLDLVVVMRPGSRERPEISDTHLAPPLDWPGDAP